MAVTKAADNLKELRMLNTSSASVLLGHTLYTERLTEGISARDPLRRLLFDPILFQSALNPKP